MNRKRNNAVYTWWTNILKLASCWHTFLDSFVLVTSAFWHRQKLFSAVLMLENNFKDIMKDLSKLKTGKTKFLFSSLCQRILQFGDRHSTNMLQNQNQQGVKSFVLSWYILRFNEWCQACPIWWQVFIYCFTDNILHRVTLEVKSPDRTLFWLVGDRGEDEHTFIKHTL